MKKIKIKNMGFTIIELLVTIVIMISILSLAIISYNNISKAKKEDAYTSVKNQVESAAREYFYANEYIFEDIKNGDSGSSKTVLLKDLVNSGYITSVTDPRTGKKISECTKVNVRKTNGKYTFEFEESSSDTCSSETAVVMNVVTPSEPTLESNNYTVIFKINTDYNAVETINGKKEDISVKCNVVDNNCIVYTPTIEGKTTKDRTVNFWWDSKFFSDGEKYEANSNIEISLEKFNESKEYYLYARSKAIRKVTFKKDTLKKVLTMDNQSSDDLVKTCEVERYNLACIVEFPTVTLTPGYELEKWVRSDGVSYDKNSTKFYVSGEKPEEVFTAVVKENIQMKEFKVSFHKNSSSTNLVDKIGDDSSDTIERTCTTTTGSCTVTAPTITAGSKYAVRGWNLDSNGNSRNWHYQNQEIDVSGNADFYAITYKNEFTTYFDKNNTNKVNSIGSSSLTCTIQNYGDNCFRNTPSINAYSGYTAIGWSETKTGNKKYNPGEQINITQNDSKTFYAIARENSTITKTKTCTKQGNGNWCLGDIIYTITASGLDMKAIKYKINGVENIVNDSEFEVSKNTPTELILTYKADTAGTNLEFYGVTEYGNTDSITETAMIDKTPPNIESSAIKCEGVNVINTKFAKSVNDKWTNKSVCYTLTPTDNLSGIDISHNYSGIGTGTFKESINTTGNYSTITSPTDPVIKDTNAVFKIEGDGKRRANYVVYDKAGNIGELNLYTNIDTIKPNCDFKVTTNKARPGNVVTPKSFESVGYDYDVNWYIPTDNSNNPSIKIEPDGSDGQSGFANYTYFMQDTDFINPMSYVINDNTTEYGLDFSLQVVDKAGNTKTCNKVFGLEKEVTLSLDVDKMKETKSYNPVMYTASMSKYGTNYSSNGNLVFNNANNPNVCSYTCDDDNKCAVKCKENPGCRDENGISCDSANYGYYFARTCQRVSNFLNYFTVDSASLGGTKIRKTFTVTNYKNDNINNDCYSHINYENSGYYTDDICKNAISETEYEKKSEFGNGLESAPENDYFIMTKKHNGTNLFDRDKNDFVNFKSLNNNASGISMVPLIRFSDLNVYNKTYSKAYQNYNYKKITDSTGGENFNAVKYEYVSPAGNISNAITLFTEFVAKCGYADSKLKDINGNTYMRSSYCANEYEDIKYWVKSKIGTTITDKSIGYDNSNFLIYSTHESTNNSSTYIINRKDCILKRVSTSTCYDLHVGSTESWTCTDNNWR